MDHSAMGQSAMDHGAMDHGSMDHSAMDHGAMEHSSMDRGAMQQHEATADTQSSATDHSQHATASGAQQRHDHVRGPGVASVADNPVSRLHERPLGLEQEPHRVLVYTDLRSPVPNADTRAPQRELELHLTANMERYMWSFDGLKFSEVDGPIPLQLGERVRLTFVNDTMMPHPLHLHGMYFELVNGHGARAPRKHTLVLKAGEKASVDLTVDAEGDWAFHCHLLYHMHAGMMRVFSVRGGGQSS
jgi:FtsP/CotA-like multicopper oxidase with cupredoxin domain